MWEVYLMGEFFPEDADAAVFAGGLLAMPAAHRELEELPSNLRFPSCHIGGAL